MAAPLDLSAANSLEEQAYRVALEMQKLELALPAENRPDNVQVTFDTEGQNVGIALSLGTNLQVTNGNAVISVNPYL